MQTDDPGQNKVISGTETVEERHQMIDEHAYNLKGYENYQNMDLALKSQVIDCVNPCYLA